MALLVNTDGSLKIIRDIDRLSYDEYQHLASLTTPLPGQSLGFAAGGCRA